MRRICMYAVLGLLLGSWIGCEKSTVKGPDNEKLTLVKPASVSIERGNTTKVTIDIKRQNMTGPVTVSFADLPEGVKVEQNGRDVEGDQATFVLEAGDKAALVANQAAKVTAKSANGMSVTETFDVTVREKS